MLLFAFLQSNVLPSSPIETHLNDESVATSAILIPDDPSCDVAVAANRRLEEIEIDVTSRSVADAEIAEFICSITQRLITDDGYTDRHVSALLTL